MSGLLAAAGAGRVLASGDGDLGAGFIAFVVVVALGIACYFLFRSMTRHLRKVPASFDAPVTTPDSDEPS
jgi:hypothetical protein